MRALVLEIGLDAGNLVWESLDALIYETQPVWYDRRGEERSDVGKHPHVAGTSLASLKSIIG